MQPNTVPTLDAARVLDALEQAVVAIAPSGEVALFSAGAELLLGLSAAAAIGRSACDLLARPADGEAALERARERHGQALFTERLLGVYERLLSA